MFEITDRQKQAAESAMHLTTINDYSMVITVFAGVVIVGWFFLCLVGQWKGLQTKKMDMGDALANVAFAVFILMVAAAMTCYGR